MQEPYNARDIVSDRRKKSYKLHFVRKVDDSITDRKILFIWSMWRLHLTSRSPLLWLRCELMTIVVLIGKLFWQFLTYSCTKSNFRNRRKKCPYKHLCMTDFKYHKRLCIAHTDVQCTPLLWSSHIQIVTEVFNLISCVKYSSILIKRFSELTKLVLHTTAEVFITSHPSHLTRI